MTAVDLLGIAAGTLTTVSFLPQVWRIWRRRSADDVSLGMYSLFAAGVVAWLCYGLLIRSAPVIGANAVTLLLACTVIGLKLRYARRRRVVPTPD